ncbi:MAG: DUF1211 domain-containing protein [Alphaproteobacteria bacterium]|nr:DUF1211 domain-containing protein [Alphaproteobacteria bacterium]
MSDKETGDPHLHRLVLFSDAVFAIAITLLAIEIHPPEHWSGISELFYLMRFKLQAFAVSFAVIGIYWMTHRRVFARLKAANGVLDVLNFMVLGLVSLTPLCAELLWERGSLDVVIVYVGLVSAIGAAMGAVWGYAAFIGKLALPFRTGEALFLLVRLAVSPGLFCGLTMVTLVKPAIGAPLLALALIGLSLLGRWVGRSPAPTAAA